MIKHVRILLCSLIVGIVLGCSSGGGSEGTYVRSFMGEIKDQSGQSLAQVEVELLETGNKTTTDAEGTFEIGPVEYSAVTATFELRKGDTSQIVPLGTELPKSHVLVSFTIRIAEDNTTKVEDVIIESPTPIVPATNPPEPTTSTQPTTAPPRPTEPDAEKPTAVPSVTHTPPGNSNNPSNPPTPQPEIPTPVPTNTTVPPTSTPAVCLGDVDGDGQVALADLTIVLSSFGLQTGDPGFDSRADLNGDGVVNSVDQQIVQDNFGNLC